MFNATALLIFRYNYRQGNDIDRTDTPLISPDNLQKSENELIKSPRRLVSVLITTNNSFDPFYRVSMYNNSSLSSIANIMKIAVAIRFVQQWLSRDPLSSEFLMSEMSPSKQLCCKGVAHVFLIDN